MRNLRGIAFGTMFLYLAQMKQLTQTTDSHNNRLNEASLQQMYEAMLTEIQQMNLVSRDKKNLIAMLHRYRSAWNSYINRIKVREGNTRSAKYPRRTIED